MKDKGEREEGDTMQNCYETRNRPKKWHDLVDGSHKEEMLEHGSEANKEDKFFGGVQNNKRHNTELTGREK